LNATAPFGGRGDVYGVDLGDPIESDGVLDLALDFAWTMELPKPGRCNLGPLHECVDPLVAITTHGVVVGDRLDPTLVRGRQLRRVDRAAVPGP